MSDINFKDIILGAAKPAVQKIVEIQGGYCPRPGESSEDFNRRRSAVESKELDEDGLPKSPVTRGDTAGQKVYVERLNAALGVDNIYYKNEEAAETAEARANEARKDTAKYRIAIDPIDGTGNYGGQKADPKTGVTERFAVKRSLEELTESEWKQAGVRPGWGSMVAIQERQENGDFKTVASAVYESHSTDTPDQLRGKLYFAENNKSGVRVIDLQTGEEEHVIATPAETDTKRVAQGGFPKYGAPKGDGYIAAQADADAKSAAQKAGQKALQRHAQETDNHLIDFSCVAQSALAVITGKVDGFFQGHPNLHDVLAIAHLADKAGMYTMVLDKNGADHAVQTPVLKKDRTDYERDENGSITYDVKYPVFMAKTPEMAADMAEKYIAAAGLDKQQLTFRNGDWEEKSFDALKAEMFQRAGKQVSGEPEVLQQPTAQQALG